jgi:hypothetical protein
MRWVSLPILAQFYIWMYAGKLKSEIVTYIESSWYFVFICVSNETPLSHRFVEAN